MPRPVALSLVFRMQKLVLPGRYPTRQLQISKKKPASRRKSSKQPPRPPRPPPPPQRPPSSSQPHSSSQDQPKAGKNGVDAVSAALRGDDAQSNNLLAPVHIPEDPRGVLKETHPATDILTHSSIVVTRQLELMNVMIGFEQANKYVIMDPTGNHIGYMAERELGMGNVMARQMLSTHRAFTTHVFDKYGVEVLRFHRPFSWISSRIGVYDPLDPRGPTSSPQSSSMTSTPGSIINQFNQDAVQVSPLPLSDMRVIGEAQQQWAPLRRKYNLFLHREASENDPSEDVPQLLSGTLPLSDSKALQPLSSEEQAANNSPGQFSQFAYIDEPFLSWDFSLLSQDSRLLGSVNRNFAGFGRELLTDTGVYALRMDAAALGEEPKHIVSQTARKAELLQGEGASGMTLDQRAVMLATAVSVDFDYFSRKSGGAGVGGGFWPIWFPGGGGGGGAAGEAGAETGGAVEGTEGAAGAGRGVANQGAREATEESAAAGAGTMAGYEAMQRGSGTYSGDDASPTSGVQQSPFDQDPQQPGQIDDGEQIWGSGNEADPWSGSGDGGDVGGGGGGEGGGGGWFDWLSDLFGD